MGQASLYPSAYDLEAYATFYCTVLQSYHMRTCHPLSQPKAGLLLVYLSVASFKVCISMVTHLWHLFEVFPQTPLHTTRQGSSISAGSRPHYSLLTTASISSYLSRRSFQCLIHRHLLSPLSKRFPHAKQPLASAAAPAFCIYKQHTPILFSRHALTLP